MSTSAAASAQHKRRQGLVHKRPLKLDQVRNEINVTPLVDVCLVLLIIFMIISELLARGKEVPLPRTKNHATEADQNQPIVAIDADGLIYFDKEQVQSLKELKQRVREEWRANSNVEQRVFVKADASIPYGKVYPLIIAMHELGVPGVDLGTNERKDEEE